MDRFDDEEDELQVTYDPARMERFVNRDRLLFFVVNDMVKKGHSRATALEVTFNGYVRDDSAMIREYKKG